LLKRVIEPNPKKRMTWEEFFCHELINQGYEMEVRGTIGEEGDELFRNKREVFKNVAVICENDKTNSIKIIED